jgi:hypothetical protein
VKSVASKYRSKKTEFTIRIPHIEQNSPTNSDGSNSDRVDLYCAKVSLFKYQRGYRLSGLSLYGG